MKRLFIPYELAVIAKEKGFDEPCFGYWNLTNGQSIMYPFITSNKANVVAAPLYQQIVDWFREKHKVIITIDTNLFGKSFGHITSYNYVTMSRWANNEGEPLDYYEALNKAILEAFKLI